MNILKATHTCFPPRTHLPANRLKKLSARKIHIIRFCSSGENESDSDSPSSPSDGDKRKQEILARIAMLQTQKVRLTDFLDERSAYLTQFAEEANAEFDQIGESALKELDEASARCAFMNHVNGFFCNGYSLVIIMYLFMILQILENLEGRMQAFDESVEVNRQEIERNERELEEFEDKIERDRNEGLFFKNLTDSKKPKKQAQARAEAQKVMEVTQKNAGSNTRRSIYLALMALLGIAIANSVLSYPEVEWRRVVAFALIFLALLTQYVYELNLSSDVNEKDEKK